MDARKRRRYHVGDCENGAEHHWILGCHRLICERCGCQVAVETCAQPTRFPEPAGTRSLLCGHFAHRRHASDKRLWDELRLSMAYQPGGEEAVTEPDPPAWFLREWMGK